MDAERKKRLEALAWWKWNQLDEAWIARLDELVAYYAENRTLPPKSAPGGIGRWVSQQRRARALAASRPSTHEVFLSQPSSKHPLHCAFSLILLFSNRIYK